MTEAVTINSTQQEQQNNKPSEQVHYYAMALDPIHVGTGGYRLGRVDNTIMREPGTNLPKLPGTSLSGACRAYTAMVFDKYDCAGQGQKDEQRNKKGHCGEENCPICVSFGFAKDTTGFQGLAQFSDVRILFFPVHSLAGPVWITCPAVLSDAGVTYQSEPTVNKIKTASGITLSKERLNLGWLMLETEGNDFNPENDNLKAINNTILSRSVLVPDKLFSQIVNDNLEVRTSVSINPETGAAEEGALFTYEAIPRSTIFFFTINYLNEKFFKINGKEPNPINDGQSITIQKAVEKGLEQFKLLGIGGMNTRGMGRLWIYLPGREDQP